jgi:hypothetical protein
MTTMRSIDDNLYEERIIVVNGGLVYLTAYKNSGWSMSAVFQGVSLGWWR